MSSIKKIPFATKKAEAAPATPTNSRRNFPYHTLEHALINPQKIVDEMGGRPFNKLLLADAVGIKPASTNFRDMPSPAIKYGLINSNEKSTEISLTEIGSGACQNEDPAKRMAALHKAAFTPEIFKKFYDTYSNKKLPSSEIGKILTTAYEVPKDLTSDFAKSIVENGRFTGIV